MAILVIGASSSCEVCLDAGPPGNPLAKIGDFTCQYYYDNYLELKGTGQQCITAHLPENQVACGCGNAANITTDPSMNLPVTSAPVTSAPVAVDVPRTMASAITGATSGATHAFVVNSFCAIVLAMATTL
jgi:hypothetical protein